MRLSTRVFFRLMRILPKQTQLEIALVCLTYLSLNVVHVNSLEQLHRMSIKQLRRLILACIEKGA